MRSALLKGHAIYRYLMRGQVTPWAISTPNRDDLSPDGARSRVDQIWVSRHFRAESVTAQKTIHSDHRMVVCDLIVLNEKLVA